METLGFDEDERMCVLRTVAGILHFGNIEVKQRPREEWAAIPNTTGMLHLCWGRIAFVDNLVVLFSDSVSSFRLII